MSKVSDGSADSHDWLTVHRVRLKSERNGINNPMPRPEGAIIWRFNPELVYIENGLPTWSSDVWGGFALHASQSSAQIAFAAGDNYLPFAEDIVESWHALVVPIRHHGTVKWRDEVETNTALKAARQDPCGPLMVITTAGYDNPGPEEIPRMLDFFKGLDIVVRDYRGRPENIRATVFVGGRVDGRDGTTMTIWRDVPSMMASACKSGYHADLMSDHKVQPKFDRSSWTRLRIIASSGGWDGDPLETLA